MTKYIFITGGVVSSLGKGIAAASIGQLLENKGFKIRMQKLDPYINVDPGTMSPYQHGEVYVTDDGAETDLDLGHYERFTNSIMNKDSNITAGAVYYSVIMKERKGDYLGKTVQVIPHITDEIKAGILKLANDDVDVVIVEIGGTVGDFEGLPFLEAIRQFRKDVGRENVLYVHLTFVPFINVSGETKTKPTQHSVIKLRELGITPDIILCRTEKPLSVELKDKITLFCDVDKEAIIDAYDVDTVYEIPLVFKKQGLDKIIIKLLNLTPQMEELPQEEEWMEIVNILKNSKTEVTIAVVGKYIQLKDAYKSIIEALIHGGIPHQAKINIKWVDSEELIIPEKIDIAFKDVDGILIPGGFGYRGIEGKIEAVRYARENKIPFLGICLGLQCAVIEFAKNVAGLENANSSEVNPNTPYPVIGLMETQKQTADKGGTMRLGLYSAKLLPNSFAHKAYEKDLIYERHRHRYEVNNKYRQILATHGLVFSGLSLDDNLVEIIELKNHTWFVATQFHPEFKSKPTVPHPLFRDFVGASLKRKTKD
ncbi:MAG: CTP synthase [bacterium]|nr:CTP synthase [bacterium]